MTTAAERKARREERLLKEMKRKMFLQKVWKGLKYIGAVAGFIVAATLLAVMMWDNQEWALSISWGVSSTLIGTALLHKAAK